MPLPTVVPPPVADAILRDYQSGMSVMNVVKKYRSIPRSKVRQILHSAEVMRENHRSARQDDPTPEELIRERDRIKNSWSVEETSRRWVGRSSSTIQAERSRALSKLIPN